jgi:hypothetical protein
MFAYAWHGGRGVDGVEAVAHDLAVHREVAQDLERVRLPELVRVAAIGSTSTPTTSKPARS